MSPEQRLVHQTGTRTTGFSRRHLRLRLRIVQCRRRTDQSVRPKICVPIVSPQTNPVWSSGLLGNYALTCSLCEGLLALDMARVTAPLLPSTGSHGFRHAGEVFF